MGVFFKDFPVGHLPNMSNQPPGVTPEQQEFANKPPDTTTYYIHVRTAHLGGPGTLCMCVYRYTIYICLYIYIYIYVYIYIYIYTSVDLSLYSDIVSGHIARRSDLKLTDSMFCLCIFSSIFSMDGRS